MSVRTAELGAPSTPLISTDRPSSLPGGVGAVGSAGADGAVGAGTAGSSSPAAPRGRPEEDDDDGQHEGGRHCEGA